MPPLFSNPNVMNQIKNFLSTETMVDVTLLCDGQSLKAHKIVLSAYSSFFMSLFLKTPCKHPIVWLNDIKYTELKLVIDFMYCGEVNIAEDQLSDVIKTAQTLRVKGLGDVEFENSHSNSETEKPFGDVSKNKSSNAFCFKWNNHTNVMNEFKNFLASETMVDVTLGCDGNILKAHKLVLSACSPFFRSLFLENPCKHPIVILNNMKYTELKSVIDFMYCGELNLGNEPLSAVMKTAQALKVKGLIEVESQSSQSGDESGNLMGGESKNQSAEEMSHEPICMINVSNWTLTQKESLDDQTIDGGFITEIKQENVSDDMDVDVFHAKTSIVSLESHDTNPFLKPEQVQPIEESFEKSFPSEGSFEGSASASNSVLQQIIAANNVPKMGRTKTQSSEDRLLKKRLAEKIRQEKIKKDPDRFLQEKFKRRLKYENKKKKGTVKPVNKMSLSEKREQRKKWQENSRRYRQHKKMIEELVPKTPSSDNEKKNDTNLAIASALGPSNASTNCDGRMSNELGQRLIKIHQDHELKVTKIQNTME